MKCPGCGSKMQSHDSDTCHITYDSPRTYESYIVTAAITNESLMRKYGASPKAKVPGKYFLKDDLIYYEQKGVYKHDN